MSKIFKSTKPREKLKDADKEKLICELEAQIMMHENEINKLQKRIKELSK